MLQKIDATQTIDRYASRARWAIAMRAYSLLHYPFVGTVW
jgi:hypothetical protein